MRKLLLTGLGLCLLVSSGFSQRKCGIQQSRAAIIAAHPEAAEYYRHLKGSLQSVADNYLQQQAAGTAEKTTTVSAIPVVFHIVVTSAQLAEIGGTAGVAKRCDSQIAVLNRDFNRQNSDSTQIPALWKSRYGNAGIHFGLAHTDAAGHGTPGYDIRIITASGFSDISTSFATAKHYSASGLDAWDATKYLNVWCINFIGAASGTLGITEPKSDVTAGWIPLNEEGICIIYNGLGKRATASESFPAAFDLGITLTHECGHFFEIWHPWGDDETMPGQCPWDGGADDGLFDTPPESVSTSGAPAYVITGGTLNDGCQDSSGVNVQTIGIPCLDYMDYADDAANHMFTKQQTAVMAAQVATAGENYSLTQNPTLLNWPASVATVEMEAALSVYPNPSTGIVHVSFNQAVGELNKLTVTNYLGQAMNLIDFTKAGIGDYSVNLSGVSKGIYFVTCNFASGSISRKILIQ